MNSNKFSSPDRTGPDYVDIHGRDIRVVVDQKTGDILIPLNEVKATGFTIYPKSQYNKLLVDEKQFNKEFNLYLLKCAQSYILANKVSFSEAEILRSIDNCRRILTGDTNSNVTSHFLEERSVGDSADGLQIVCSTNKPAPLTKYNVSQNERRYSRSPLPKQNSPASSLHNASFESQTPSFKKPGFQPNFDLRQRIDNSSAQQSISKPTGSTSNFAQTKAVNGELSNWRLPKCDPEDAKKSGYQINQVPKRNYQTNGDGRSGRQDEFLGESPTVLLDKREHKVAVSFVEKRTVCWVQRLEDLPEMAVLFEKVTKDEPTQKVVARPVVNCVYIAQDEGFWYRCKVVDFNPLKVLFVDYGNTVEVDQVKSISEEIAKFPYLAVRVTFAEYEYNPTLEDDIVVCPTKRFEDGTYLIRVKKDSSAIPSLLQQESVSPQNQTAAASPPIQTRPQNQTGAAASTVRTPTASPPGNQRPSTPTFFTKPPPLVSLQPDQIVVILKEDNGTLFLRTRECHVKLQQIEAEIKSTNALPLGNVSTRQLVLVKKPESPVLSRAVVTSVSGTLIEVDYLDYAGSSAVSLSSLHTMTESLCSQPITFVTSPKLSALKGQKIDEMGQLFIRRCIQERTKFVVQLSGETFDLRLGDNTLLSEKLVGASQSATTEKLVAAPQGATTKERLKENRVMYADMPVLKSEMGIHKFMCHSFTDFDQFILMPMTVDLATQLELIIKGSVDDPNPYQPIKEEMCLGLFEEAWYRCVVTGQVGQEYHVRFVDFGNEGVLTSNELRKISDDTKVIPILGLPGKLVDLHSKSRDVLEKLKLLISEDDIYDVNVKRFVDGKYEVTIPSIYEGINI